MNVFCTLQKVAAAWSRANLPPPELDTMFRSIEGIYKANRSLLSVCLPLLGSSFPLTSACQKLKEIGTNPKGLGDLLMKWVSAFGLRPLSPSNNVCRSMILKVRTPATPQSFAVASTHGSLSKKTLVFALSLLCSPRPTLLLCPHTLRRIHRSL